jgi:hypothetical protein
VDHYRDMHTGGFDRDLHNLRQVTAQEQPAPAEAAPETAAPAEAPPQRSPPPEPASQQATPAPVEQAEQAAQGAITMEMVQAENISLRGQVGSACR